MEIQAFHFELSWTKILDSQTWDSGPTLHTEVSKKFPGFRTTFLLFPPRGEDEALLVQPAGVNLLLPFVIKHTWHYLRDYCAGALRTDGRVSVTPGTCGEKEGENTPCKILKSCRLLRVRLFRVTDLTYFTTHRISSDVGLYRKERPPVKHNQVKSRSAGSKPRHFHTFVYSQICKRTCRIWRIASSANASEQSQILPCSLLRKLTWVKTHQAEFLLRCLLKRYLRLDETFGLSPCVLSPPFTRMSPPLTSCYPPPQVHSDE